MARKSITIRLRKELIDELDDEADAEGVSRSEYVRNILQNRHAADELEDDIDVLRDRLDEKESRIDELENQLARRSQMEEKVDELAIEVRERRDEVNTPWPVAWYRWLKKSFNE